MAIFRWVLLIWLASTIALAKQPEAPAIEPGAKFAATDTLACGEETSDQARQTLAELSWPPATFSVQLEAAQRGYGDFLVRFASARPIGDDTIDMVAMEWFAARDADNAIRLAPAVVVVHESGRRMPVGRLIARGIAAQGLHAFLIQLPGYGVRRVEGFPAVQQIIPALHQAIADVRRARDAVAALPVVDSTMIGLQGTSLGGFVAATVAGLDRGYDRVFIVLAGGNVEEVFFNGSKEVAKARTKLAAAGITDDQIKEVARRLEPLRLAHRINPAQTWLYCGQFDTVVPRRCGQALAKAARLDDGHHIELPVDHYSGIVYLPQIVSEIQRRMVESAEPHTVND
jgi:dienelactone hydrolase